MQHVESLTVANPSLPVPDARQRRRRQVSLVVSVLGVSVGMSALLGWAFDLQRLAFTEAHTALGWLLSALRFAAAYRADVRIALPALSIVVCLSLMIRWASRSWLPQARAHAGNMRALAHNEHMLTTTLNCLAEAVIVTDRDGRVVRMNAIAEQLTGWSIAEARDQPLDRIYDVRDDQLLEIETRTVQKRAGVVVEHARDAVLIAKQRQARRIVHRRAVNWDSEGCADGAVVLFHDSTQERESAREINQSRVCFERLASSGSMGIVISDFAGNILEANAEFLRLTGASREDLRSGRLAASDLNPGAWLRANDEAQAQLDSGGVTRPWERELIREDGTRGAVVVAVTRLDPSTESLACVVDISDKRREAVIRRTEAQRQQAHTLEATGRLAGGVAHDFNNLLAVVLCYCELLLRRRAQDAEERSDLLEIKRAAQLAAGLTRQLLAFSSRQVLEPRVVDLGQIVVKMERMVQQTLGELIAVTTRVAPALWKVRVDPGQIQEIMTSLLVNARDAMPRGGRMSIAVENVELDESFAAEHMGVSPGRHVMLTVADTGTGMDEPTLARALDPFFTTKKQGGRGVGLGLSTVFGIVQQSGGHFAIGSTVGVGTTFTIYFPEIAHFAERPADPAVVAPPSSGGETILLVDDEVPLRAVTRRLLERQGYTVLEAASPSEAVEICRHPGGAIHLLLTDVVMPPWNGRELVREALPLRPSMKVLYMSGCVDDGISDSNALDPGTPFLQKPFTARHLEEKVRAALEGEAR